MSERQSGSRIKVIEGLSPDLKGYLGPNTDMNRMGSFPVYTSVINKGITTTAMAVILFLVTKLN